MQRPGYLAGAWRKSLPITVSLSQSSLAGFFHLAAFRSTVKCFDCICWRNQFFQQNGRFFRVVHRVDQVDWNDTTICSREILTDFRWCFGHVGNDQFNSQFFQFVFYVCIREDTLLIEFARQSPIGSVVDPDNFLFLGQRIFDFARCPFLP